MGFARHVSFRGIALLSLWAVASIATAGCDRGPGTSQTSTPREPVNVIAVAYPMADVVRQIGGDRVHVEWLLESGQPIDSFEPDESQKNRLGTADLVVSGGFDEPWAIEGFDDPTHGARVIRLDLLQTARTSPNAVAQLWLDPLIVRESAQTMADRLRALRPGGDAVFQRNANTFTTQIDSMLMDYRPKLDALAGQKVITLSPAFSALTSRFGIVELRPVSASPLKLSDLEVARIRRTARAQNIGVMLVDDDDVSPQVAQDLADRTGLRVITLDSLGTSAKAGNGNSDYFKLLRYNLEQLIRIR